MLLRKLMAGLVVMGLCSIILVSQLQSQPAPREGGQGRRARGDAQGPGRGRFDFQQMQQRMMDRMRENMGATEAEWKVIEPRLSKVMTLSREARFGGRGFGFRPRGQRGQGGPGGQGRGPAGQESTRAQSEVAKSMDALRTVLENQTATPDQIKKVLTALRTAREKSKQELFKAQTALRQVLNLRQEAQLVMMGMLE